ncbi:MAG: hypothetical protein ABL897_07290 [Hyphomicrobium sp.]
MWTLSSSTHALTLLVAFGAVISDARRVEAQNFGNGSNPYYFNNRSYSYGLQLPQVPQPNGQDEIRAADGTTCRSSMASNNAYLDVGGIGGQGIDGSFDSGTVYGRMIIPLGDIPNRLDCSSLYNLEIERLKHELALVRSGMGGPGLASASPVGLKDKAWAEEGWSNKGWSSPGKAGSTAKASAANLSAGKLEPAAAIPKATVVPMRLLPEGTANLAYLQPAVSTSDAEIEILPWSNQPAQGARVLVGVPAAKKPKPNDNFFPD